MNEKRQRERIDPEEWLPHIFHTFYGRVVDKGNRGRYQPEMLMRVPQDMIHEPCYSKYSARLKRLMKGNELSLLLCTRLVFGYYLKIIFTFLSVTSVNGPSRSHPIWVRASNTPSKACLFLCPASASRFSSRVRFCDFALTPHVGVSPPPLLVLLLSHTSFRYLTSGAQ